MARQSSVCGICVRGNLMIFGVSIEVPFVWQSGRTHRGSRAQSQSGPAFSTSCVVETV